MKISADFKKTTGEIKPMHAVGQPPMFQLNDYMMHYLAEAGIPYSRLHDVQGPQGVNMFVDVPNIFRDFDADETLPESYDFALTDAFLAKMKKNGVEPFYRLGVTIENCFMVNTIRLDPPKDFAKWARICEHIVRHYNEGWASGFRYGIRYWEIWNEPDDGCFDLRLSGMWKGTPEQFFEMYTITAKHLKQCFGDSIQVGGYGASGFWEYRKEPNAEGLGRPPQVQREGYLDFAHRFLEYIGREKAPLDFYSWHSYANVSDTAEMSRYCRRLLKRYGFGDVPDFLNEWNTCFDPKLRSTDYAAAQAFGMMLTMQKTDTKMLNYYDARCGCSSYGGMFNPDTWEPYITYFTFKMFNDAYVLKNEIETSSESMDLPVCGASDGSRKILLASNMSGNDITAELDIRNADVDKAEIIMTNGIYRNTITGRRIKNNTLQIPKYTCVEVRF